MKKFIYVTIILVLTFSISFAPACAKIVSTDEASGGSEQRYYITTELIEACKQGNDEDVKRFIQQNTDVNIKDNNGWTALMLTSQFGYTDIAEMLIDNGADVNAKGNKGGTALMLATAFGYTEIVEILIDNGADVNAKDYKGTTALMVASDFGLTEIVNLLKETGAQE